MGKCRRPRAGLCAAALIRRSGSRGWVRPAQQLGGVALGPCRVTRFAPTRFTFQPDRRSSGSAVGQQLALELQDATFDVVQRLVDAIELALDLGGIARAAFLARNREELDQPGQHAPRAGKPAAPEGARPPRKAPGPGRRLGTRGALTPQQGAAQELQLTLLVPQFLNGRLRLDGRLHRHRDRGAIDFGIAHRRQLHGTIRSVAREGAPK